MEERQKYFEEALSDFVHDAASGGAIRHLVDLGYSVDQMMRALSYPTPRERVRKTAYRYMLESGLLVKELPDMGTDGGRARLIRIDVSKQERLNDCLYRKISENGAENVYISCPFGMHGTASEQDAPLPYLNSRELEYIRGIPWENMLMYHRATDRMQEIGRKLLLHRQPECRYYFLKTGEILEGMA
ncbi:MAG: hypothetical protein J6C33_12375 [Lachnospiraceae bacterium]|nr:hypothetical protein [Lachnospiraceae bacterium]